MELLLTLPALTMVLPGCIGTASPIGWVLIALALYGFLTGMYPDN